MHCARQGGATNNHEGNVSYRTLVHEHQDEYLHAAKSEKKEVARSIVSIIRSRGGGFLKKCEDGRVGWVDIGSKKAREKVSQALREGLDAKTLLATKGINKPLRKFRPRNDDWPLGKPSLLKLFAIINKPSTQTQMENHICLLPAQKTRSN